MFQRPVFLGVHPDDICMNCGGIMFGLKAEGKEFHIYTFSKGGDEIRHKEWIQAMSILTPTTSRIFSYRGDDLPDHRYEIRRTLETIKERINPDVVFTHSLNSIHQSHRALAEEVERIMRFRTVLGYAHVKDGPYFTPRVFMPLTREDILNKTRLIRCFKSQTEKPYMSPEIVKYIAHFRGISSGVQYAEAFDLVRMML